jgi:cell division septation protein DedD
LPSHSRDDDFREIQLNGKQLVFLFMVATVFSVVVFLCGVFVGRGVRAERAPLVADAGNSTAVTPDFVPNQESTAPPAGSDPTAAAPPPAVDELSYFNRLDKSSNSTEDLKPVPSEPKTTAASKPAAEPKVPSVESKAAPKPADVPPTAAAKPAAAAAAGKDAKTAAKDTKAADAKSVADQKAKDAKDAASAKAAPGDARQDPKNAAVAEPSGPGFALQVTALKEKGEAETIARRLASKGYSAYVLTPGKGAPAVFRVRIGKFKTRKEAEVMASRLQKEEQFTPWITR